MSLWVSRLDGWIDVAGGDKWKNYSPITLQWMNAAQRLWDDDFLSSKPTSCMPERGRDAVAEGEREGDGRGPHVDGSLLTGLACVITPVKVNVYRCGEANAGQHSVIGQLRWLIIETKWLLIAARERRRRMRLCLKRKKEKKSDGLLKHSDDVHLTQQRLRVFSHLWVTVFGPNRLMGCLFHSPFSSICLHQPLRLIIHLVQDAADDFD